MSISAHAATPAPFHLLINGKLVAGASSFDVINPATEQSAGTIILGTAADVDRAVAAARKAFESFGRTSKAERLELLKEVTAALHARTQDFADAIREEMGAPSWLATGAHVPFAIAHFETALKILPDFEADQRNGSTYMTKEPIGVVGMITPWNWPLNQIACKVAPAIAAGCTMILKPSEFTPTSALIFAEVMHAAGVPKGVFNLVNGLGPDVGVAMSEHPGIDMISFTGSTRAGIDVAKRAADTVKRVSQELGGKSPNVILEDADLAKAVSGGVASVFSNSGQSCNAPTRMIVPAAKMKEVSAIAKGVADKGTKKCPFDCFFFWQVVHAVRPIVTWFTLTTQVLHHHLGQGQ